LETIHERPARRGDTAHRRSKRKNKGEGSRKTKQKPEAEDATATIAPERKSDEASTSGKIQVTAQVEDNRENEDESKNQV